MRADPGLLLDVTRSLRRLRHSHPSGIDRVERAYIRHVVSRKGAFVARIGDRFFRLDTAGGAALLALLDGSGAALDMKAWLRPDRNRRLREGESLVRRHATDVGLVGDVLTGSRTYLNVGHVNLEAGLLAAIGARGLRRVVLLHDLIPLDHPEFSRPGVPEEMAGKLMATCVADILLTNSADTAERASDQALSRGLALPSAQVLPLGLDLPVIDRCPTGGDFICLGTIEPRKNHALLLDIWQEMWEQGAHDAKLHIIGRRGWLNEAVFQRLDTAPMMGRTVFEHPDLDDHAIATHLSRASALLFPSLAEGYGLPLTEALALGVPAIASDLSALREVGGQLPLYLDPQDRQAWKAAIIAALNREISPDMQTISPSEWQCPTWEAHFHRLDTLLGH